MDSDLNILQRMTKRAAHDGVQVPQTSARAMRQALTRAADTSIGLPLTVRDVHETVDLLDTLLPDLQPGYMHIALLQGENVIGCLTIDPQFRSAVIECQTTGKVGNAPSETRAMTGADMLLALPVLRAFLSEGCTASIGSDLEGWFKPVSLGAKFAGPRSVGLALENTTYRSLRLTVSMGDQDRLGEVAIILPLAPSDPDACANTTPLEQWGAQLRQVVHEAPFTMDAVIARFPMTIGQVDSLQIDQVVPLFGADLGSVKLFAPKQTLVKCARLGQSAGMRAVRIGAMQPVAMADIQTPEAMIKQPA